MLKVYVEPILQIFSVQSDIILTSGMEDEIDHIGGWMWNIGGGVQ